jgi:hypothetical protein
MMVFQETIPTDVGPVRSSRYYYIAWAAEMRAVYAHAGGSPQALDTLRRQGNGQLVYNADEFRWGGSFRRIHTRNAPHNLYTTGKQLRSLAAKVGAKDRPISWPWIFNPDAPLAERPVGGYVQVRLPRQQHHSLRVRPVHQHLPALGDGREAAGRRRDEGAGPPRRTSSSWSCTSGRSTTVIPTRSASKPT